MRAADTDGQPSRAATGKGVVDRNRGVEGEGPFYFLLWFVRRVGDAVDRSARGGSLAAQHAVGNRHPVPIQHDMQLGGDVVAQPL